MAAPPLEMRPWAEVDLDAIAANVTTVAQMVRPARVLAVVKADGYGHGAVAVARTAEEAGASMIGVATVAEGLVLRRAGLRAPILAMGPAQGEEASAFAAGVAVTAADESGLLGAAAAGDGAVHLKIDSGMSRLGFSWDRAAAAAARAADLGVHVNGVFTHLAAAGEDAAFTKTQLERFGAAAETVRARFPGAIRHAAATAAIVAHPESHLDMVRLGLGMYGLLPSPHLATTGGGTLRPALSLWGKIAQVRRLSAGDTVGYSRTFRASGGEWIATVTVGYGDGYPRNLGGTGTVMVGSRRVPVVGRVNMEYVAVDLGTAASPGAAVGDPVLIYGPGLPIDEVADAAGTISYEVLTRIAPRVRRVYLRAGAVVGTRGLLTADGVASPEPALLPRA